MKNMKDFIIKAFKDLLNMEVRVINLPEDEIDMGIFIVHDKRTRKMSEKELSAYSIDFGITRLSRESNPWLYLTAVHFDAVVRNNEVISPPDTDYKESTMTYNSVERALEALIISIVKANFDDLLLCREEMEEEV